MKLFIIILLSIITTSSCESDNSDYTQKEEEKVPKNIIQNQHIDETDSIIEEKNTKMVEKPVPQKSHDQDTLLKPSAVDVDIYPGDPFEDPDYIGTPCGDYLNGNCTRHSHHSNLDENEPGIELKIDSLK